MSDGKYRSARNLLARTETAPISHRAEQRRATSHAAKGRAVGHESRAQAKQKSAAGGAKDASTGMSRGDYAQSALMTQILDDIEASGQWGPPPTAGTHAAPSQSALGTAFKALKDKMPDKQPTVTGRGFGKTKGFSLFFP